MFVNRDTTLFLPRPRGSGPTVERRGIRAPLSIISSAAGALATTQTDNSVEASRHPPRLQPPTPPHTQLPKPASPKARRPSLRAFISVDDAHKNGAPAWIIGSAGHRLIGCCSKTPHWKNVVLLLKGGVGGEIGGGNGCAREVGGSRKRGGDEG